MDSRQNADKPHIDQSSTAFEALGVIELLEADQRATFVVHADSDWISAGTLRPIFSNSALRKQSQLIDDLFRAKYDSIELHAFARWIYETTQSRHLTQRYANVDWCCTQVASSWLVIGATRIFSPDHISDSNCSTSSASQQSLAKNFDWTRDDASVEYPDHVTSLRNWDWTSTDLGGDMSTWSDELRTFFNLIMRTDVPQALYWGPDFTVIYNQAYIPIIGAKHPELLGRHVKSVWSEDWQQYGAILENAYQKAVAIEAQQCLILQRFGFVEEAHFDYSAVPVVGSTGHVVGLHVTVREITESVLAERRLKTTISVRECITGCPTIDELYRRFMSALEPGRDDVAFAVIYVQDIGDAGTALSDEMGRIIPEAYLKGSVGLIADELPRKIATESTLDSFGLLFQKATTSPGHLVLSTNDKALTGIRHKTVIPESELNPEFKQAVVYPFRTTKANGPRGFLLMGLNSRRPYDQTYQQFITDLSAQLNEAFDTSINHLQELQRQQQGAELEQARLQKALEQKARETKAMEQRFTRMAAASPAAMTISRLDGSVLYANNTWHKYFGKGPESLRPMAWLGKLYPEDLEIATQLWSGLAEGNVIDFEYRIKKPWISSVSDDVHLPYTWLMGSAYAETNKDGETEVVSTSIDISHHKWISQESQKRTEEAIRAKQQQDAFTDMVAHEIRNPLNAIVQCADMIQTSLPAVSEDTVQHGSMQEIIENARTIMYCAIHQKHIVDDLLTLSKLDSDLLSFVPVKSNPATIMTQMVRMFEGEAEAQGISLTSYVDPSITNLQVTEATLDPQRVSQVLINLITNAIKFTRDRPVREVNVSVCAALDRSSFKNDPAFKYFPSNRKRTRTEFTQGDLFLRFSVTDTGPGIPAAAESRLFRRFSQASLKSHVVYGGSGLGLWISRELTEMQGGEIGFKTHPEGGTTFAFYIRARSAASTVEETLQMSTMSERQIPIMSANETQSSEPLLAKPVLPLAKEVKETVDLKMLSVLLVEDNLLNQKIMKHQLQKVFKSVLIANNGQEAVEVVAKHIQEDTRAINNIVNVIDLILMDIEMPVLNGVESAKAIRQLETREHISKRTPIIAISANARAEQILEYRAAGMDEALPKPFLIRDLIKLAIEVL